MFAPVNMNSCDKRKSRDEVGERQEAMHPHAGWSVADKHLAGGMVAEG